MVPSSRFPVAQLTIIVAAWATTLSVTPATFGQGASLTQAMAIKPKQANVPCDRPTAEELKSCDIEKTSKPAGFVVADASGRTLRRFLDTNGDGKLDQWSYFQNGIEVYRDVDADFDRKADQYRWLGAGGIRWGLDPNEDGTIDTWKVISPEEVAYECFMAVKSGDAARFQRLLLTPKEFTALRLGTKPANRIKERWQTARGTFSKAVVGPLKLPSNAEWVQWGNGQPSMCAAGTEGSSTDIVVFDHASCVYQSGKDFGQLAIGTIIKVGDVWRLVELPEIVSEGKPINNGGVLFPMEREIDPIPDPGPQPVPEVAKLYESLQKIDEGLDKAQKGSEIAKLWQQKAAAMQEIYFKSKPEDRRNWLANIADSVQGAYQDENYPNGLEFLDGFIKRLKAARITDGIDYVAWRSMYSKYGLQMKIGDNRERDRAEQDLLEDVEDFVDRYPRSEFAAEGMFQLALNAEITDRDNDLAIKWYKKIVDGFPNTNDARRAAGAIRRLTGEGKPLQLTSKTAQGRNFSMADRSLRGKIVIMHFWENWCADGFETIERLAAKHKDDVVFIGCNTDSTTPEFRAFISKNRNVTWLQLHEPGGVEESPLAHQLGVSTLPLILMVDAKGNLIETNLAFGDLEREIQREIKRAKRLAK